jgi:hypothetical protein
MRDAMRIQIRRTGQRLRQITVMSCTRPTLRDGEPMRCRPVVNAMSVTVSQPEHQRALFMVNLRIPATASADG